MLFLMLGALATQQVFAEEDVVDKAGKGIKKGGEAAGRGLEKGANAAGRGIRKGADATSRGVRKGLEATGKGLEKAGKWIDKKTHGKKSEK